MKIKTNIPASGQLKIKKTKVKSAWVVCLSSLLIFNFSFLIGFAQRVAINSTGALPNPSALLDVDAAPGNNKGILIPRLTLTQTTSNAPIGAGIATSLLVYNTATVNDVTPGYYYWEGTQWVRMLNQAWLLTGNAGTTAGTNFLGTTDAKDLVFKTNNTEWMRIVTAGNVGIGTSAPNSSAKVDITSTSQGFAMPRMTTVQRLAIATPTEGLQIYDISLHDYYYFNGTKWDCARTGAGTVTYFANATAPVGYLECNGQSVSTTVYPELFSAIGYLYGGSGATFNVPDLRGEFLRSYDDGRGVDAGRVLGSFQGGTVKGNTVALGYQVPGYPSECVYSDANPNSITSTMDNPVSVGVNDYTFNCSNWTGTNHTTEIWYNGTTRPRNVALLPCIKY